MDGIYRRWDEFIRRADTESLQGVQLYINFPFCYQSRCAYCMYKSNVIKSCSEDIFIVYLNKIHEALNFFKPIFKGVKLRNLYIGGGTPSLLSEKQIDALLYKVFSSYSFGENAEKTFENSPSTCTREKIRIYQRYGINRVSLGVQSLKARVLKLNNRRYVPFEHIQSLVDSCKQAGIAHVNADLMAGIRGQNASYLIEDFEKLYSTPVDSVIVYIQRFLSNNTRNAGNPGAVAAPDIISELQRQGKEQVRALLKIHPNKTGFPKEDNHFFKGIPWMTQYRTNGLSERKISTLGIGSSAISFIRTGLLYRQSPDVLVHWFKKRKIFQATAFTRTEQRAAYLRFCLYNTHQVCFSRYRSFFGDECAKTFKKNIVFLTRNKFIRLTREGLALTPLGIEKNFFVQYLFYPKKTIMKNLILPQGIEETEKPRKVRKGIGKNSLKK